MDMFIRATAGILVAVVLGMTLAKQGKDISLLLVIAVCCMIFTACGHYLAQVVSFLEKLQAIGQLNSEILTVLMKATGIGILSELTGHICADAGNASLGKALQILSVTVILWLALPLFSELLTLTEEILGNI